MERNTSDDIGSSGASGLGAGTDSLSVTGEGSGQNAVTGAYDSGTSTGTSTGTSGDASQGRLGAAQEKLGQAKDAATEKLGQAREKATALKATLADKLEAGANTLRERAQSSGGTAQLAGAGPNGASGGLLENEQVQRLAGPAADAMERTADFLRNGDVREALEEQVRTNPGRTLLIALGLGYVLGKTLRR